MTTDVSSTNQEPDAAPVDPTAADTAADTDGVFQLQQDLEKFRDLALRSKADLDNYRKRMQREKEDAIRFANTSLLEAVLPILDNFELGLEAARQSADAKGILEGMSMVLKQLQEFLRSQGAEIINTTDAAFDPNLHEAVAQESSDSVTEGHIIRQLRKGYKLRDRLLRPAMVVISKGSE
ncbi:MAG: nucleotide exchange factor GrpE [Chthoniobacterales bacterium]